MDEVARFGDGRSGMLSLFALVAPGVAVPFVLPCGTLVMESLDRCESLRVENIRVSRFVIDGFSAVIAFACAGSWFVEEALFEVLTLSTLCGRASGVVEIEEADDAGGDG